MKTAHRHAPVDVLAPETQGRTIHWAKQYDRSVRLMTFGRDRALRKRTAELAAIQPGEAVLDVGCGTGDLTLLARQRAGSAGQVAGIDASPEMIAVARAKAAQRGLDVDYRIAPVEALPFPDGTFDVVLSSLMMHHLPGELKQAGLAEIARVLKPGGRLVVVDFQRPTTLVGRLLATVLHHGGMATGVQDLSALMAAAGFIGVERGATGVFPLLGYARGRVGGAVIA